MEIKFTKPTVYMSHSIAGDSGDHLNNCQNAQALQRKLEKLYPEIKWYCPGRVNLIIDILVEHKALSYEQIINADLEILRQCHGWFWWYTSPSKGCRDEEHEAGEVFCDEYGDDAEDNIITVDLLKANVQDTRRIMQPIVDAAVKRFRERN